MADTRPNINLPAGVWVDVNAALNAQVGFPAVSLGTALNVKAESETVRLCEKGTQPLDSDGFRRLTIDDAPVSATNDVGLWALSVGDNGAINVEVE
ncbi:MAG: hypothetical protein Tp185DCM00d2C31949991_22 [Prokaryotic dsDNA virus sp.]|nr:MAG: hypothetical protein Tp162SUR1511541_68 [Prokaryotic dsDNA virus sp.]QDP56734.1 MAG: hypothetical protein Tp185DCM00d2C31949991_22 [Prokaryotic dsDNA virus sp.]QDP63748.1 MAG: hypothetical protein Unbinned2480contig1002_2 [Prokaryotic dsDNA virus sp.]QDP63838.1 MAG: hypothetical protein GOVbin2429_22 [Prokaryotic dsDNA virus sp.]|tara:strand:+ start:41969 stop:42256 length:288 start_codon:yes stop_codon:yes gene_type:complete